MILRKHFHRYSNHLAMPCDNFREDIRWTMKSSAYSITAICHGQYSYYSCTSTTFSHAPIYIHKPIHSVQYTVYLLCSKSHLVRRECRNNLITHTVCFYDGSSQMPSDYKERHLLQRDNETFLKIVTTLLILNIVTNLYPLH